MTYTLEQYEQVARSKSAEYARMRDAALTGPRALPEPWGPSPEEEAAQWDMHARQWLRRAEHYREKQAGCAVCGYPIDGDDRTCVRRDDGRWMHNACHQVQLLR
jgi:hypothetical protein